jgi:hypothetical protein
MVIVNLTQPTPKQRVAALELEVTQLKMDVNSLETGLMKMEGQKDAL